MLRSTISTSGLPSGIYLRKFFENTRDKDHRYPTLTPRAFQKISDANTQRSPQEKLANSLNFTQSSNCLLDNHKETNL